MTLQQTKPLARRLQPNAPGEQSNGETEATGLAPGRGPSSVLLPFDGVVRPCRNGLLGFAASRICRSLMSAGGLGDVVAAKKLTIEVNEEIANRIEQIARRRRQSISELTSSLYQTLSIAEIDENLAPITARYKGVIADTEIDARRTSTERLAHKHG